MMFQILAKHPAVLLTSGHQLQANIDDLADRLDVSPAQLQALFQKCPALMKQRMTTLHANATTLAQLLDLPLSGLVAMAMSFPQLLYLDPITTHRRLTLLAMKLDLPLTSIVGIVQRVPSLIARDPVSVCKRLRLARRIALRLGDAPTIGELLLKMPTLPTYGLEHLLLRWLMAHLNLWQGSLISLIAAPRRTVQAALFAYAEGLPQNLERRRLEIILARGAHV